jgi:hypothetical protein
MRAGHHYEISVNRDASNSDKYAITGSNGVVYPWVQNAKDSEISDQAGSKMEVRGTVDEEQRHPDHYGGCL